MQFSLRDGSYAYGRVLRDASVAFYRVTTREPKRPPIGSRDYQFVVGVYSDVLRSATVPVVGHDPSTDADDVGASAMVVGVPDVRRPWRLTGQLSPPAATLGSSSVHDPS